jgi:hypothetical protein
MVDINTFLTTLYVMVDDFFKNNLIAQVRQPGQGVSLSRSEVVTLAMFGQWDRFESERDFYRYAHHNLRPAFPSLPDRSQFNRLLRTHCDAITCFFLHLVELMKAQHCAYEALDSTAVPTRDAKRRGRGWLAGLANIGWSNRLGWYEGFHLLVSVNPVGVITGFGFSSASTSDQPLAESFFSLRRFPDPRVASVGTPALGPYVADKGFEGKEHHQRWQTHYGADVICPPQRSSKRVWPKKLRRWLASIRQIVETVNDKLLNTFRLSRERPHELRGFQARLAAKVALHNFCISLNEHLGRPRLAFADLINW